MRRVTETRKINTPEEVGNSVLVCIVATAASHRLLCVVGFESLPA